MDWNSGLAMGLALILIFVLYLIDKHHRWRQLVKLAIGLVVLGAVGLGGLFGFVEWDNYRTEKRAAASAVPAFDPDAAYAPAYLDNQGKPCDFEAAKRDPLAQLGGIPANGCPAVNAQGVPCLKYNDLPPRRDRDRLSCNRVRPRRAVHRCDSASRNPVSKQFNGSGFWG